MLRVSTSPLRSAEILILRSGSFVFFDKEPFLLFDHPPGVSQYGMWDAALAWEPEACVSLVQGNCARSESWEWRRGQERKVERGVARQDGRKARRSTNPKQIRHSLHDIIDVFSEDIERLWVNIGVCDERTEVDWSQQDAVTSGVEQSFRRRWNTGVPGRWGAEGRLEEHITTDCS